MGLVAPRHMGSSRTRARTRVPCIGRRILNRCATREVPILLQPHPPALATTDLFSICVILSCQECCILNGIIKHVTFGDWLCEQSITFWRFVLVVVCISRLFLLTAEKCPRRGVHRDPFNHHPLKGVWVVAILRLL